MLMNEFLMGFWPISKQVRGMDMLSINRMYNALMMAQDHEGRPTFTSKQVKKILTDLVNIANKKC